MEKCHFEYKGLKYDNLSELYPIIKGEEEIVASPVTLTDTGVVIKTNNSSKNGRVASNVQDIKSKEELDNLTQYKLNKFIKEVLIKTLRSDVQMAVADYFLRGGKVNKESIAEKLYGRPSFEISKQMKALRWASDTSIGSNTIDEIANTIANDSISNFGVELNEVDIMNEIINTLNSYDNLNDIKLDTIEKYLEEVNPYWNQEIPENIEASSDIDNSAEKEGVESLPFKDFIKTNAISDNHREQAMASMAGGEFIEGKTLLTPKGTIMVTNVNPNRSELFSFYYTNDPDVTLTNILAMDLAEIFAYNIMYEAYISGVSPEFNTPPVVEGVVKEVKLPSKEEALRFEEKQQETTPFLSVDKKQQLKSYGYNPDNTSHQNLASSLRHILETSDNPVLKTLAAKFLDNIHVFANIEFILDNDLNRAGVATSRANESTGIRLNPEMIGNSSQYARVLLEEMTHALTRKEARNLESPATKRLIDLYNQARAVFGEENIQLALNRQNALRTARTKDRNGIPITREEQELLDEPMEDNAKLAYALSNFDEFIAHIGVNGELQTFLRDIKESDTQKSLYRKFVDIIQSLLEALGMTGTNDGIFKYALHDMMAVIDESVANSNIGRALHAQNTRSKSFVYNKLGLKTGDNADIEVGNIAEVMEFINTTYSNLIALPSPTNPNVVKLHYRDEVPKDTLKRVSREISDDASYSFDGPLFEDDGAYDPFGFPGFSDDGDFDSYGDAANNLDLQLKIYLMNLNDRYKSLQQSKDDALESPTITIEQKRDQAIKVNSIEKQIDAINAIIKRITDKRSHVLPFNNLISVAYTAMDELAAIDQTLERPLSASDVVYMLQTVKFWKDAKKGILVEEDFKDTALVELFSQVERQAEDKLAKILPYLDKFTVDKIVKKNTRFNGSKEDLAKEFVDLNKIEGLFNNLGVIDSSLLQAIGKLIKEENEKRGDEVFKARSLFEKIAKKGVKALKSLNTNKEDTHDIFRQRDRFGRKTRNIVTRFSNAYQNSRNAALGYVYNRNSEKSNEQTEKGLEFLHNNTEQVKYSVLFPLNEDDFNQEAYDTETERLKSIMGANHYTEWFTKQSKLIADFKKQRSFKLFDLMERFDLNSLEEVLDHDQASRYYNNFMETNSIYGVESKLENYTKGTKHFTLSQGYNVFKYIVEIPKENIIVNGKETVAYDVAYKTIEKNPEAFAYYNAIRDALESIGSTIPYETGDKIAKNGLPEFKAEMYQLFMENGMKVGIDAFVNSMYDMTRTEKDTGRPIEIDVITGKEKQRIPTGLWSSNALINQEMQIRKIEYQNEHGIPPNDDMLEDWQSEITEKYANEMQGDLSVVIPMYITLGLAYKHKAKIEPSLIVAREMFNHLNEYERDKQGNLKLDTSDASGKSFLRKPAEESFTRAKEVVDGTYSSTMYGNNRDVNSGKTKILSPAEKRDKKVLEDAIAALDEAYKNKKYSTDEYTQFRDALQKQIDRLGAYHDKEKLWDIPLAYTQWLGMGWNVVGGISNSLFGFTSNLIEAAGGEFYTQSDLAKAYKKVFRHSFVRNATFNRGGGEEAIKIRSLMDRYTILSDSGSEYKSLVGADPTAGLKWLSAFNMNERTEYINQAPLMLVMLENNKFEHNGESHGLYKGFNTDGSWNTEEYGEEPTQIIHKAILKAKALVERNHGNYNAMSPILAKRTGLGRLVMQFRTWMVEGVRTRLGDREGRPDEIFETTIKGRYWSAYDVFRDDWSGASKGLGLQVIRNFIPFGNKWMSNFTPIDKFIQGNENVTTTDIANMKRLAMEINIFIGTMVVMLAMKALSSDMDDDDPKKWAINLLINQGTRLRTDVLMYINPLEAQKIIQDPIPAMRLLVNFAKFTDAVDKSVWEGSPEYESGMYQGHNRILKTTLGMIPLLSQGYRSTSQVWQTFDDK